jgi:hypothetical protein
MACNAGFRGQTRTAFALPAKCIAQEERTTMLETGAIAHHHDQTMPIGERSKNRNRLLMT